MIFGKPSIHHSLVGIYIYMYHDCRCILIKWYCHMSHISGKKPNLRTTAKVHWLWCRYLCIFLSPYGTSGAFSEFPICQNCLLVVSARGHHRTGTTPAHYSPSQHWWGYRTILEATKSYADSRDTYDLPNSHKSAVGRTFVWPGWCDVHAKNVLSRGNASRRDYIIYMHNKTILVQHRFSVTPSWAFIGFQMKMGASFNPHNDFE